MRQVVVFFVLSTFVGCSNKDSVPVASTIASSTNGPIAPLPDAPDSPLAVVLESKNAIIFSGVDSGVVIADEARTTLATATFGGESTTIPMPTGLPAEGRIVGFLGRVPNSIWVSFEEPGKTSPKNPFLRLERKKNTFK